MDIKKNDEFEINITDFSDEGLGIGRSEGFTWFVKDAVIGDRVIAAATRIKKSYGYARLVRVVSPSDNRIAARCPAAAACGGCQIQQLKYSAQLKFKHGKVLNDLRRIGGLDLEEVRIEPIKGMEEPYRYRGKAVYPIGRSRDGRIIAGFYAGRTHSIIECTDCLICDRANAGILRTITGFMEEYHIEPYDEKEHRGVVRNVLIRQGRYTGETMVCIVINADELADGRPALTEELGERLLRKVPGLKSFSLNINRERTNVIMGTRLINVIGPGYIEDTADGIRFRISPHSFYQVNPVNMISLYRTALEYAGLTGTERVWDLYCGVGTISLFMAEHAGKVYGVEVVPEAVENARGNAAINGIDNVEFFTGRAEEVLPAWYSRAHEDVDVIVVDPPRKGCDVRCLDTMLKMAPERIVYVSCNPSTLARDLKYLAAGGYRLERVRACDMFPHTVHVETVCFLGKRKPDTTVRIGIDMEDYYRIREAEKET